jgi:two-component system, OmpR family, sensor kinase
MSRFFVKIYLAVILTLLITGLIFDRVWFSINQQQSHLYALEPIRQGLEGIYSQTKNYETFQKSATQYFQQLNQTKMFVKWRFKLVPFAQVKSENIQFKVHDLGFQVEEDQQGSGKNYWLKLDPVSTYLVVANPMEYKRQQLDIAVFILFYLAVALGVFLAIRPIIKEMQRLQTQVSQYGMDGWHYRIRLPKGSPFKSVVDSFNQMASRIEQLVISQKELSHAVAHELRTPLARIKFSIESLKQGVTDPQQQASVSDISQDIAELDCLVSEMLDYASFDAAAYQLQLEKGLLNVLLESLAERFVAQVNGLKCKLGEPIWLVCDWHLLDRALQNIITNAIKYGNGEVAISVSKQAKQIVIHIDDNGSGIDERYRDKIFESFTRLPQHRKDKRSGFGLGLPIVKKIIELHQGKITIESSPLQGARLNIFLPI